MKISKDPLEPLRCWKELFFGERAFKNKKAGRNRRRLFAEPLAAAAH